MPSPSDAFQRFTLGVGRPITSSRQFSPLFSAGVSEVVRRFSLRFYQAVTSANPVDLGTSRSGWTPSVGTQVTDPIEAPSDDDVARQAAAARLADNTTKAGALARSYLTQQGQVFFTNPVPWIVPLNDPGTSSQAQRHFIQRAIRASLESLLIR